jgi:hypothetical protein
VELVEMRDRKKKKKKMWRRLLLGGSRFGFWQNEKQEKFTKLPLRFQIMLKFCIMFSLKIDVENGVSIC